VSFLSNIATVAPGTGVVVPSCTFVILNFTYIGLFSTVISVSAFISFLKVRPLDVIVAVFSFTTMLLVYPAFLVSSIT
jgi:hypothetical protein